MGIRLENNQLPTIAFADDQIVIAENQGMEYMLNKLKE